MSDTKISQKIARLEAHQHQLLKLNLEDAEAFVKALKAPAITNYALITAALRYKQVIQ